jgi:hypothetical protein
LGDWTRVLPTPHAALPTQVKASASTKSSGGTGFSLGGLLNKE